MQWYSKHEDPITHMPELGAENRLSICRSWRKSVGPRQSINHKTSNGSFIYSMMEAMIKTVDLERNIGKSDMVEVRR